MLSELARAGFGLNKITLACFCVWLSACSTLQESDAEAPVSLVNINQPKAGQVIEDEQDQPATEPRTLLEHRGSGSFVNSSAEVQRVPTAADGSEEMVRVSFENAPIGAVLEVILGDLLQLPYSLEGEVGGQITLVSTDPVPQTALLDMLESALEVQGIAMVAGQNGIYRIGPSANLRREIPLGMREAVASRGYSVRIIPLQHLSVTEAEKILLPLGLEQNILRVDPLRNILMLGASAPQMQNALRTLKMLDVDVLSGMSFGIYEMANLDADVVVSRIEAMIGNPEIEGLAGATRVVALEEINSVMVVAPSASQLNTVSSWVKRLDTVGLSDDDEQTGSRLYVYSIENGEARHMADLLGQVFSGTEEAASPRSTAGRVAPGLETSEASTSSNSSTSSGSHSQGASSTTTRGGARIVADEANNSLLIMSSAKEWRSIRAALSKIDKLPAQVLVEVSIWEVTLSDELRYGVEWFFNSGGGVEGLADRGGLLSMSDSAGVNRSVPGFSYLFSGSDWRAVINTLSSRSHVKSLSSPSILVQDNKEASIQVGNQQPIQTSQTVNTANTGVMTQNVELKDTGVQLTVKPRVNSGGLVIMDILQDVTDVGQTDTATGQRTFLKRSVESTVAIQSGDTIILGGLIQDNDSEGDSGVPFLHKIPVLGGLFGTKIDSSDRTELLVTISPRAINQYQDFARIGDEFRNKMKGVAEAFSEEFGEYHVAEPAGAEVTTSAD